ncbi:MAG: hypothetical protein COB67_07745 [SAR324 cluster bacterium]|uniref:NnrS family protein n=1 Tax=SAR324 cluster bacterium TaxID=2024889 RepID=A0A2A4T2J0_9DELT|nr:MAG: hypothetical protein COB67_07745 [SAR324 cluster bacterium]
MYKGISLDQAPPEDIPLRFFLSAPLFGVLAGLLVVWRGGDLFISNWNLETIAITHLLTLGWLAMVMFGAFYQMVPVLVGGSVPFIYFARMLHSLFAGGIALFVAAFFVMNAGFFEISSSLFAVAAALLLFSILCFFLQLAMAVFKEKANDRPTVVAMRISMICLLLTMLLGISFIGNLTAWWALPWDRVNMTGIHVTLGLFGWVGTLLMGVGFHMIPMFYLTPSFDLEQAYRILRLHSISLLLIPISLYFDLGLGALIASAIPGALAAIIFVFTLMQLLGRRRRRIVDTTMRFWQSGIFLLPLSLLCLAANQWILEARVLLLFGVLFILGYAVALTNGMLYKIYPFILWFHRYSNLIGKVPVPLLQDLAPNKFSRKQWHSFTAAIALFTVGILWQDDLTLRVAGMTFALSSLWLFQNILRAYRMEVPEAPEEDPDMAKFMEMLKQKKPQ